MSTKQKRRDRPMPRSVEPKVGEWVAESSNVWTCYTGFENMRVTVVYGHRDHPGVYVWTCYRIGQETVRLDVKSEEEAKAAAIKGVCQWLVDATIAMDRARRSLGLEKVNYVRIIRPDVTRGDTYE